MINTVARGTGRLREGRPTLVDSPWVGDAGLAMAPYPPRVRRSLRLTGVVQGVGFRPHVHQLASSLRLSGLVGNDDGGVFVEVEGPTDLVGEFVQRVADEAPPLAQIDALVTAVLPLRHDAGFAIVESRGTSAGGVTAIPPDVAPCPACLAEMRDPRDRRYRYPFIACTRCGPRYTIVSGLPYDRPFTTMSDFPLCDACAREYADPADRRFHAQPTACPACGPRLRFRQVGEPLPASQTSRCTGDDALAEAMRHLANGAIVAVKGVGGYHLACDATWPDVVARLRGRKQRGDKPFAVMVRDAAEARRLVVLTDQQIALLESPQAPILLADVRHEPQAAAVARAAAPGLRQLGVMLPSSPLHHLLFQRHPQLPGLRLEALVMTSGNLADEPLCIDSTEADARLAVVADAFLHHDRRIHSSCDDSVVRCAGSSTIPIRRSRGFAPLPLQLPMATPPVLAVGGEVKATLCVAAGTNAWLSQHVGDTENLSTLQHLDHIARALSALTRVEPSSVIADAHPGYLSRGWAQEFASRSGAEFVTVQHHHAHLASLLAEHQVAPDEPVLGVVFDGTGYGTDATIWGGELLLGSYAKVARVGHLRPVQLPGGDAATRRPARAALAHLQAAGIEWDADLPPVRDADETERRVLATLLTSRVGCTPTTSMGRLFDAVASLLDVRHDIDYEGQAAMELEALATASTSPPDDERAWRWSLEGDGDAAGPLVLDPTASLVAAVAAMRAGAAVATSAWAFHQAAADAVVNAAIRIRDAQSVNIVGLSGGVFQNALLAVGCAQRLRSAGFTVLTHHRVPPNDGGLALGQVAVVSCGGGE